MSFITQFSDLPKELKLQIFGYLDYITIRRVCSFVSKEFKQLSLDCSLFKCYKQTKFQIEDDDKAALELRDELYINHLTELKITPECLEKIKYLKFKALEKLILQCNCYFNSNPIQGFHVNPSTLRSIEFHGKTLAHQISGLCLPVPLVTAVDTLQIETNDDVELISKIPSKRVLFNGDSMSLGQIHKIFQENDHVFGDLSNRCKIQIILEKVLEVPDALNPKFEYLMQNYVGEVNWHMNNGCEWQLIVKICELCNSLEELAVTNISRDEDASAIRSLSTTNLKNVCFHALNCENLLDDCSIVIDNVQDFLKLSGFDLSEFSPSSLRVKNLDLVECTFPSEFYLLIPDCMESLDIFSCTSTTKFEGIPKSRKLKSLTLSECSFETVRNTLSSLSVQKLRIERLDDESLENYLKLTHMNFEGIAVIEFDANIEEKINLILKRLLFCMPQASVLDFTLGEESISKKTFRILTRFTQLKYFSVEVECYVSERLIRRLFPSALVKVSVGYTWKYQIFL